MDSGASTPRVGASIEQQWPPKVESRWYSYKAAWSAKDIAENPEIPHRGSLLRFCDADNTKLEEAFKIRRDELERSWWEEEAAVLAGPKGPQKVSGAATASTQSQQQPSTTRADTAAPDGSPSWIDFMAPDKGQEIGILVRSGSYEVDLPRRQLRPCYWPAPFHRVLRGTWFAEKAVGEWVPLREFLADQLEQAYISQIWAPKKGLLSVTSALTSPEKKAYTVHAARLDLNTIVDTGLYALFVSESEAYLMRDSTFQWLKHLPGAAGAAAPTKFKLRRGYVAPVGSVALQKEAHLAAESIDNSVASNSVPTELVLVVHGIGQTLERANITEDALALRAGLRQLDKEANLAGAAASTIEEKRLFQGGGGGSVSNPSSPQKLSTTAAGTVKNLETTATVATDLPPLQDPSTSTNGYSSTPISRVEVLPVQWRRTLSLEVDQLAAALRPPGIPSLRQVLHSTAVEVLLYLTPLHRAAVLESLVASLNSAYSRFMLRNPEFKGPVSVVAHSLGSILCWDILCNQPVPANTMMNSCFTNSNTNTVYASPGGKEEATPSVPPPAAPPTAPEWSAAPVEISQLSFQVDQLILAGSPLGCFLALRGINQSKNRGLGTLASARFMQCHPEYDVIPDGLPAVRRVYHIYHPYDPVAYRLEPLAYPENELARHRGALVELYGGGGGKRFHIAAQEFGDSMSSAASRLGSTLAGALTFGRGQKRRGEGGGNQGVAAGGMMDREQGARQGDAAVAAIDAAFSGASRGAIKTIDSTTTADAAAKMDGGMKKSKSKEEEKQEASATTDLMDTTDADALGAGAGEMPTTAAAPMDLKFGRPEFIPSAAATSISRVAGGELPSAGGWPTAAAGRIDFALQEASLENQYLAALKAHFIYWGSMDVALFIYRAVKGLDVVNGKPLVEQQAAAAVAPTVGLQPIKENKKASITLPVVAAATPEIVFGEADQLAAAPT